MAESGNPRFVFVVCGWRQSEPKRLLGDPRLQIHTRCSDCDTRYNGNSHQHTNTIEKQTSGGFHVHDGAIY